MTDGDMRKSIELLETLERRIGQLLSERQGAQAVVSLLDGLIHGAKRERDDLIDMLEELLEC